MTYQPLRDSTEFLFDGDKLRDQLSRDGYILIRNLIPRNEVLEVRSRLLTIASEYQWLDNSSPEAEGVVNPELDHNIIRDESISAINRMWCDEAMHGLRIHRNILALFERIFKEPAIAHPRFTLRHVFPGSPATTTHQDHVHVGGEEFYSMWSPLGDCSMEQGVLALVPNSHRGGLLKAAFAGMGIIEEDSWSWVSGAMNAGDVIIFSNLMVHKALPNLTKKIRLSFDARYQAASLPIATLSLTPPIDSGCMDWESVYKDWVSKDNQYYWNKFNLQIVDFDATHYEIDYPVAFERAKAGDKKMRNELLKLI